MSAAHVRVYTVSQRAPPLFLTISDGVVPSLNPPPSRSVEPNHRNEATPEARASVNLDLRNVMFTQNAAEPVYVSSVSVYALNTCCAPLLVDAGASIGWGDPKRAFVALKTRHWR